MSEKTKIEWCDSTVNPVSGCSVGCGYCYAEKIAKRNPRVFGTYGAGARFVLHEPALRLIAKLNRKPWICDTCGEAYSHQPFACCGTAEFHRRRIFYSLGDWLDDWPIEYLCSFLLAMHESGDCDFLLLTKKPEQWVIRMQLALVCSEWQQSGFYSIRGPIGQWLDGQPPANIWVGTSCENQAAADKRIPKLLLIPAAKRFVSFEPLTGNVELESLNGIAWIICGGMSGPGSKPCNVEWIRSILRQCKQSKVPAFCKQIGSIPLSEKVGWRICLRDTKGGDPSEWPEDLRVREFPK